MEIQPDRFVSIAQQYCSWVEGESLTQEEEIKKAISLVVDLYSNALMLPKEGCGEDLWETGVRTEWHLLKLKVLK